MIGMERSIIISTFIVAFFLFLSAVNADTYGITSCGVILEPGNTYVLQNDITETPFTCWYANDSVDLDLNGHTVTHYGNGVIIGILTDVSNFNVRNGVLRCFGDICRGIGTYAGGVWRNSVIGNLNITGEVPLFAWYTHNLTGINLNLVGTRYGIEFLNSSNNRIILSDIFGFEYDIVFNYNTFNNTVCLSNFDYNKVLEWNLCRAIDGFPNFFTTESCYQETLFKQPFDDAGGNRYKASCAVFTNVSGSLTRVFPALRSGTGFDPTNFAIVEFENVTENTTICGGGSECYRVKDVLRNVSATEMKNEFPAIILDPTKIYGLCPYERSYWCAGTIPYENVRWTDTIENGLFIGQVFNYTSHDYFPQFALYGFSYPITYNWNISVFDSVTNNPIYGASVDVYYTNGTLVGRKTTDYSGTTYWSLDNGQYWAVASKTNYTTVNETITVTGYGGTNIWLVPLNLYKIEGYVKDDGSPIRNAEVCLFWANGTLVNIAGMYPSSSCLYTSGSGYFFWLNVPSNYYFLRVRASGYAGKNTSVFYLSEDRVENITLSPSPLRVTIYSDKYSGTTSDTFDITVNIANGVPSFLTSIYVIDQDGHIHLYSFPSTTNTTSVYTIANLPFGRNTVYAEVLDGSWSNATSNSIYIFISGAAPNITQPIPQVNETEMRELGYGWMLPFFYPATLYSIFALMVSGVVAIFGRAAGFAGSLLIFVIIYTWYGIYPLLFGILLIIIVGFLFAYVISKMFGG